MTEQDKLRVMLGHWIEHNREHAGEFLRWVDRAGPAAEELQAAAAGMEESSRRLSAALERLGGPLSAGEATHGPGHAHDHPHGHGPAGDHHDHPHGHGHPHDR